jgi:hypothetical protein
MMTANRTPNRAPLAILSIGEGVVASSAWAWRHHHHSSI